MVLIPSNRCSQAEDVEQSLRIRAACGIVIPFNYMTQADLISVKSHDSRDSEYEKNIESTNSSRRRKNDRRMTNGCQQRRQPKKGALSEPLARMSPPPPALNGKRYRVASSPFARLLSFSVCVREFRLSSFWASTIRQRRICGLLPYFRPRSSSNDIAITTAFPLKSTHQIRCKSRFSVSVSAPSPKIRTGEGKVILPLL